VYTAYLSSEVVERLRVGGQSSRAGRTRMTHATLRLTRCRLNGAGIIGLRVILCDQLA